ncbi:hypothetical protein C8A03DRAFT_15015 [Achaetomium macrosporum]|uniref:chitinase n=1 Tax=Achaetomium macrosporum TaxID=79813 RepID=A0AAN7CAN3_9PEZI|nr:hypothetical protein C8A03DRAFT_15015 [Achaetomium macrosporum]
MWLPRSFHTTAVALLAWSALVRDAAAQVTTDCFPMNKTCPPNPGFGMDYNFVFNTTPNYDVWETTVGPVEWDADRGAIFRITKQGDSPTIRTKFYYFFGRTEIHMKAAKGTGVISSMMLLSDNLDEIDWEYFGGNDTVAQTNYFGKNVQDYHNAGYHIVPGGVQADYHNYTSVWTKDYLDFYIDGAKVRTLLPKDANNSYYYPQTPMRLSIGIWAGGDPRLPEGTREWAGGTTDYSQGPFEMFVKSAHITDYSSGKEYEYTDKSGSWQSIKVVAGNSTVHDVLNAEPEKSLAQKWAELPTGAKVGVYAGSAAVGALMVFAGLFYCIRQRRRGAREAAAAEARAQAERLELERFKKAGVDPDSFASQASEYNAKEMRRDGMTDKDGYSVPPSPSIAAVEPSSLLDSKWDSAVPSMGAAVALPLLHESAQSPPASRAGAYSDRNPGSPGSPPGMISPPQQQPHRSFTAPDPQMRMASPAPSQHDFSGMQRSASPAQLAHPQPQRSFTTGGYGGQDQGNGGGYWGNGAGHR